MSQFILYVPCGENNRTERFIPVPARHVTLQGFEEFLFCLHRFIDCEFRISKTRWVVAGLPAGLKVGHSGLTQQEAITNALRVLRNKGKTCMAQAFKDALNTVRIQP